MKDFLTKIGKALNLMKSPYNDKKTIDTISEETQKVIEYCKKLKDSR